MSRFTNIWKAKNTTVEKPGASTHTSKWDRCVEHVKASGGSANAYAVCTAMLGEGSFKSATTDEEYKAQIDAYMHKLGIAGAGPVPNSLLARQDLEGETQKSVKKTKEDMTIELHGGSEEATKGMVKAAFEGCEMEGLMEVGAVDGVTVFLGPDLVDNDGHRIGCYVVMGQDGHPQVFFSLEAAVEFINSVFKTSNERGVFVPHEDVISEMRSLAGIDEVEARARKGQLEDTKKELIDMAQESKHADVPTESIVENIKAIQLKRQKATIKQREKDETEPVTSKSFKQRWSDITSK